MPNFKIKLAAIYKIEHISGYYYIGMSVDVFSRWESHYTSIKTGSHSSPAFQKLWESTKPEEWSFTILEYISKTDFKKSIKLKKDPQLKVTEKSIDYLFRHELLIKEREWMNKYSRNFALNKDNKYFS